MRAGEVSLGVVGTQRGTAESDLCVCMCMCMCTCVCVSDLRREEAMYPSKSNRVSHRGTEMRKAEEDREVELSLSLDEGRWHSGRSEREKLPEDCCIN